MWLRSLVAEILEVAIWWLKPVMGGETRIVDNVILDFAPRFHHSGFWLCPQMRAYEWCGNSEWCGTSMLI